MVLEYGPSKVMVLDFDERIVSAVKRFADRKRLENLDARLYNALDALPEDLIEFDCFYTNPARGQFNDGKEVSWSQVVLANVQSHAAGKGFFVARMLPELHLYHLDDAPELKSCNLLFRSRPTNEKHWESDAVTDVERLEHFYGRSKTPRAKYVRELKSLNYGQTQDSEYELEPLESHDD